MRDPDRCSRPPMTATTRRRSPGEIRTVLMRPQREAAGLRRRDGPTRRRGVRTGRRPTGHDGRVSAEDLEAYENDLELDLYREYRDVVSLFSYVVETDRRFYLANG